MKPFITFVTGLAVAWGLTSHFYDSITDSRLVAELVSNSFYYGCIQYGQFHECKLKRKDYKSNLDKLMK